MKRLASFAAVILATSVLAARGQVERSAPGNLDITPPQFPNAEPAPATTSPSAPAPTSIEIPRSAAPPARPGPAAPADSGPLMTLRPNQEATVAAMMGSVNEVPVFVTDLFKTLDPQLTRLAQTSRTVGDFRRVAANLIEDKLIELKQDAVLLSAADAALTAEERSRVDVMVNLDRGHFISEKGGSEAAAEKWLRGQSPPSTLAQWTSDRKIMVKKEIYFSRTIGRSIEVTQQMARDAYLADIKHWQVKAQIQLYQITIPASRWLRETSANGEVSPIPRNATPDQVKAAEGEAMRVARDIVKKLRAGGDFARLAEEYHSADEYLTNGGKWPKPLDKGALVDTKRETYLFSLPAKTLQEPNLIHDDKYPYSEVQIIKTGEKTEARTIPFTEAQGEIVGKLQQEQRQALYKKKMIELMSAAAYEALDRNIAVAVDAAVLRYATK